MDKEFFKDFTLHLDKDRVELASSRLEEEEKIDVQEKELFASFSLAERHEDKEQKYEAEIEEGEPLAVDNVLETPSEAEEEEHISLDDIESPPEIEEEEPLAVDNVVETPSEAEEEEHISLDDIESPPEIEEEEVSNVDWNKVLDELDKELETESYKSDVLDHGKKDNSVPDTETEDIAKWNLFNYEDDGNIEENYKDNTDFSWPSEEPKEENNTDIAGKSHHKDSVEGEAINDKSNLWEVKDQEELKEILVYLDDLFGNLPENVIREFALSPYYIKYNDILDKLGI